MTDTTAPAAVFRSPPTDAAAEESPATSDSSPEAMSRLRDPFAAQPTAPAPAHSAAE
jgi:hypothetical protein